MCRSCNSKDFFDIASAPKLMNLHGRICGFGDQVTVFCSEDGSVISYQELAHVAINAANQNHSIGSIEIEANTSPKTSNLAYSNFEANNATPVLSTTKTLEIEATNAAKTNF